MRLGPRGDGVELGPLFNGARIPGGAVERGRAAAELTRIAGGDREALADLYRRYAPGIYRYIRSIVQDAHEAEDLTQQVFVKLMTAQQPRLVGGDCSAWLLRVARNTAIDSLRRRQRTLLRDPHEWGPCGLAPDQEARRSLADALCELSRGQRDVFVLTDVVGLTPREAARRLGKSNGAVHMLHYRASRIVRDSLSRCGSGPCTRRERVSLEPGMP